MTWTNSATLIGTLRSLSVEFGLVESMTSSHVVLDGAVVAVAEGALLATEVVADIAIECVSRKNETQIAEKLTR